MILAARTLSSSTSPHEMKMRNQILAIAIALGTLGLASTASQAGYDYDADCYSSTDYSSTDYSSTDYSSYHRSSTGSVGYDTTEYSDGAGYSEPNGY
jgi:hypothetical protein